MAKTKVVILGCTGMLGSMLIDSFVHSHEFDVVATYRNQEAVQLLKKKYPQVDFRTSDVEKNNLPDIVNVIKNCQWAINAIGVTKPHIHDNNAQEIYRALRINACFPHLLARAGRMTQTKIIQIATDCVYSGQKGRFVETDGHDALDVYGKTKSLGEVFSDTLYHLRCSIIGPELVGHKFLLEWFLRQPKNSEVNGFTNHRWNGVTSLHFARVCQGIIKKEIVISHVQHIIPGTILSKADLLKNLAKKFNRTDISVNEVKAPTTIDRTLATNNETLNHEIWIAAGYHTPPSIQEMIRELGQYRFLGRENNP